MERLYEIIATPAYLAAADRAGLTDDDREAVANYIAANPKAGELVKGAGLGLVQPEAVLRAARRQ